MYGITDSLLDWIRNFLTDRTQKVRIGSETSANIEVLSGIPQGSILGPILFTIFINDISDNIQSDCKIFADDTKIYNVTKNKDTIQKDLDALSEWSN